MIYFDEEKRKSDCTRLLEESKTIAGLLKKVLLAPFAVGRPSAHPQRMMKRRKAAVKQDTQPTASKNEFNI